MATLPRFDRLFTTRRGRALQENLTAYLFLFPALLLIFVFGIFPVGFAFFVSLHQWRRFPGDYLGLSNYVRALDNLAYVLFFWLGIGIAGLRADPAVALAGTPADRRVRALSALLPGVVNGAAILLLINWIDHPAADHPRHPQPRARSGARAGPVHRTNCSPASSTPKPPPPGTPFLLVGIAALVLSLIWLRVVRSEIRGGKFLLWGTAAALARRHRRRCCCN